MKFAHLVIGPDPDRTPFFDGGEGDPSAVAKFSCIACSSNIDLPLWDFLDAHLSWKSALPTAYVEELAELFKLNTEMVMDAPQLNGHGSRFPLVGPC